MNENIDKCDQELLTEAYSTMLVKENDGSEMAIASGPYAREARPEQTPAPKKANSSADFTLEQHIQGLKSWFNDAESALQRGNKVLALIILKNIARTIATVKG